MLVDCHVHTSRYSGCSSMSPINACRLAVERCIDTVVFTEHHHLWGEEELAPYRESFPGLAVLGGVEISLAEGFDMVLIPCGELPEFEYFTPFEQLVRDIEPIRAATFAFVAHPFRYQASLPPELDTILSWADGIEVNSINIVKNAPVVSAGRVLSANAELYKRAAERYGLIPLYNTDAHSEATLGAIANELPGEAPESACDLIDRFKSTTPAHYQNPDLVKKLFAKGRLRR